MEMFPETSGTAALSGRDLPPAAALAADKHLTALAQALKATGIPGTLDTLRARAYLHLLTGQPAATLILPTASPGPPATTRAPAPAAPPGSTAPAHPAARTRQRSTRQHSTRPHPAGPGPGPGPGSLPGLSGSVNLTMPLAAWLGWTESPGDIPGYGPVDAGDSRILAGLLAQGPRSQWCVTLTSPAGHPLAHACARHGPPGPPQHLATPREQPGPGTAPSPGTGPARHPARAREPTPPGPPGHRTAPAATTPPDWLRGLTFTTLQTRGCTHPRQSPGYQPSPALRHLIQIRNPACTAPGCRRPAARCDLDHVTPYHRGGKTCECNLGPACRHDHQRKQTPGWTLTTPAPGTFTWTTPGNRTHTTTPAQYWE